jgi:hypothetical protein
VSLHFGFKYWNEPTPAKIRRVAGALAAAGIAGCGFAYLRDNVALAVALLSFAVGGSFIAKLFTDKP